MSRLSVNVASHLPRMASQQPGTAAVFVPKRTGVKLTGPVDPQRDYHRIDYGELDRMSDVVAAGLEAFGIKRGMHVAFLVTPGVDFFAITFALFKLGAVMVCVDPGIGLKHLKTCLGEAEPEAFIAIPKAHIARKLFGWGKATNKLNVSVGPKKAKHKPGRFATLQAIKQMGEAALKQRGPTTEPSPNLPPLREGLREGVSIPEKLDASGATGGLPASAKGVGASTGGRAASGTPEEDTGSKRRGILADTQPDETAAILFTSGSTGVPKGVVYTHGNFDAQVNALKQTYDIQPGEIDLCTFPLFALYAPALGMTAIVPDMDFTRPGSVHPANVIEPVKAFGVTNLFGSPALLKRLVPRGKNYWETIAELDDPDLEPNEIAYLIERNTRTALPTLKRIISAGAPVPSWTIASLVKRRLNANARVFTPYGATESLPVCSIDSSAIINETAERTEQGAGVCVGKTASNVEMRIIEVDDSPIGEWSEQLCVPDGDVGEVVVKGPAVTRTYFRRDDATRLAKIVDAGDQFWHRMGDLGYLDDQGRLWFCGRKSQRVVTPEKTYYTACCEAVFLNDGPGTGVALVGVSLDEQVVPVIIFERPAPQWQMASNDDPKAFAQSKRIWGAERMTAEMYEATRGIHHFLSYPKSFPVDIRHNAKIGREKLAIWAAKKLGGKPATPVGVQRYTPTERSR